MPFMRNKIYRLKLNWDWKPKLVCYFGNCDLEIICYLVLVICDFRLIPTEMKSINPLLSWEDKIRLHIIFFHNPFDRKSFSGFGIDFNYGSLEDGFPGRDLEEGR